MKNFLFLKFSFTASLILGSMAISHACSCSWPTPDHFCRSVNENNHIVLAVVTDIPHSYSMDVDIVENIHLSAGLDTISILGQDGLNCGEGIGNFAIGDSVILALFNGVTQDAQDGNNFNWSISGCGLHYLRYSNGMVVGGIDYEEDSTSFQIFSEGIMDCIELSSATNEDFIEENVIISPNPTSDYLNINIESASGVEYYFDIIDVSGNIIQANIFLNTSNKRVDLSHIASGVYFLRSKNTSEMVSKKFVKI